MPKPKKNSPSSSRKKKQTRETSTASEISCDSDKRDNGYNIKTRRATAKTSSRRRKPSERSSSNGKRVKRQKKKLPALSDLEDMFAGSSSDDDTATKAIINEKHEPFPLYKDSHTLANSPNQTSLNCEQTETVNNSNVITLPNTSNQNTRHKIDLTLPINDAERYLKQLEDECSDDSSSSGKTIIYDRQLHNPITFSPLPSTSRDNRTIMQNEILFNESFTIDTSHSNNNETMVTRIDNANMSKSTQHNPVENSYETIIIDDAQPDRPMHIDTSVVIDVDNYTASKNNNQQNDNITSETVTLNENTNQSRSIIIEATNFTNTDALKTLIYIRPKDSCASTSSIPVHKIITNNIANDSSNATSARINVTPHSANATTVRNNISSTITVTGSDDSTSDSSSVRLRSELRSLENKICRYKKVSGGNGGLYRHVGSPKMNLKIISCNMKKPEWKNLKYILKVKKNRSDTMRNNDEAQQNLQSTSEDHGNQSSRLESSGTQEIEDQSHRGSNNPINLGVCPICMEPLKNEVASTLCGHLFCIRCIKSALLITGKKCPTCRKSLKGTGYHQIFI